MWSRKLMICESISLLGEMQLTVTVSNSYLVFPVVILANEAYKKAGLPTNATAIDPISIPQSILDAVKNTDIKRAEKSAV
jgi:hypothetical protein